MNIISHIDPRIQEILELAAEEHRPLALSPETIVALEDNGWMADPFTAQVWPDPARRQNAPAQTVTMLVNSNLKAEGLSCW